MAVKLVQVLAALCLLGLSAAHAEQQTYQISVPAVPDQCLDHSGSTDDQRVQLTFGLSIFGKPQNIRISQAAHDCLRLPAIKAIKATKFPPIQKMVGDLTAEDYTKRKLHYVDLPFLVGQPSEATALEVNVEYRFPPAFPQRCIRRANPIEQVVIDFDLAKDGSTKNIRTRASTNRCVEKAAIFTVGRWKYTPPVINGNYLAVSNIRTKSVFIIDGEEGDPNAYRPETLAALEEVNRLVDLGNGSEALSRLDAFDAEYGKKLQLSELYAYTSLRAAALENLGEHNAAIDLLYTLHILATGIDASTWIESRIDDNEKAIAERYSARQKK